VLDKNPDTVKVVFKHMPLRMHNMAETAALAAIAAQNQGKFWQMHDAIFSMGPKSLNKDALIQKAEELGLNVEQFKKDMNSPETRKKLAKDLADARKADVTGTPSLFINGRRVQNRGPGAIQQMIDQETAKNKASGSN
jgi:protein-disulfide isomerase